MSLRTVVLSVCVLLGFTLTSAPLAESSPEPRADRAQVIPHIKGYLSGVWLIRISLPPEDADVCPGNALLPETANVLGNFTQSGEFLSTSDFPPLQVPAVDTSTGAPVLDENGDPVIYSVNIGFGHGLWRKTTRGGFILESWRLAKVDDHAIGIAKGRANAEMDRTGTQLSGDIRLQLTLADGTALPAACGTIAGVRQSD